MLCYCYLSTWVTLVSDILLGILTSRVSSLLFTGGTWLTKYAGRLHRP
jgi:hypothetical protein